MLADCFTLAADDADWPDNAEFRGAIRAYIDRAVAEVALSHWSWVGRHPAA